MENTFRAIQITDRKSHTIVVMVGHYYVCVLLLLLCARMPVKRYFTLPKILYCVIIEGGVCHFTADDGVTTRSGRK